MPSEIFEATEWGQVEQTTFAMHTCIAPAMNSLHVGTNWKMAKLSWEQYRHLIRYFLFGDRGQDGYIRLIKVNEDAYNYPTWIADYVRPPHYSMVIQVAPLIQGTLLVKQFDGDANEIGRLWAKVSATFDVLSKVPYTVQKDKESVWLVVPGTAPYYREPSTEYS